MITFIALSSSLRKDRPLSYAFCDAARSCLILRCEVISFLMTCSVIVVFLLLVTIAIFQSSRKILSKLEMTNPLAWEASVEEGGGHQGWAKTKWRSRGRGYLHYVLREFRDSKYICADDGGEILPGAIFQLHGVISANVVLFGKGCSWFVGVGIRHWID